MSAAGEAGSGADEGSARLTLSRAFERPVSVREVEAAFDSILAGRWSPVQVGAFAVALRMRGESAEILVAAARAMRRAMTAVAHDHDVVLDTCGTGGDGMKTLNLSTGAAIVVAACGVHVAKHGNRSVSSRCGSADVLEAMGVPIDVPPSAQGAILRETKIAFLFAPAHHPALRHAAEARRELGVRTIFNALGPLANPANATHQLVGVYDDALRPVVARALFDLGVKRAWVVRSHDGLDEVSPCAPTAVTELFPDGRVTERVVVPEDFGLPRVAPDDITGGGAGANAAALEAIVGGQAHVATVAVVLNAAAALVVATGMEPKAATERAWLAIRSGEAKATLGAFRAAAERVRVSARPKAL